MLTAKKALLPNKKVMKEVINFFKSQQEGAFEKMNKCSRTAAIAQVAAHGLIVKALQICKQYVGLLLKTVKHVCGLHIKGQCDFGEGLHSVCSEPYYYESIYYFEHKRSVFVVDSCGRCCQDIEVHDDIPDKVWMCSSKCKPLTECEVTYLILSLILIDQCASCCQLYWHVMTVVPMLTIVKSCMRQMIVVRLMCHTKATVCCLLDSNYKSKLRILRSAFARYPTLRSFLHAVYVARNSHLKILKLEQTLLNRDVSALIDASSVSFDNLFSIVEEHVQDISNLEKPGLEMRLRVHNVEVFTDYQKAVDDYSRNVCCSCQQLHQKKKCYSVQV